VSAAGAGRRIVEVSNDSRDHSIKLGEDSADPSSRLGLELTGDRVEASAMVVEALDEGALLQLPPILAQECRIEIVTQ
jgi:hypothetical protein